MATVQDELPDDLELPPGWSAAIDPSSGKIFYLNDVDKTTHWSLPRPSLPAPAPRASAPVGGGQPIVPPPGADFDSERSPMHASQKGQWDRPPSFQAQIPAPPVPIASAEDQERLLKAFYASTAKPVLGAPPGTLSSKNSGLRCGLTFEVAGMSSSQKEVAVIAAQIVSSNNAANLLAEITESEDKTDLGKHKDKKRTGAAAGGGLGIGVGVGKHKDWEKDQNAGYDNDDDVDDDDMEAGNDFTCPPLLNEELLENDLGIMPMCVEVGKELMNLDQEHSLVLHLKTSKRYSAQRIVQTALKKGERIVDIFDLCAIERCPGLYENLTECCALYVTDQKRLIFCQSVEGAEIQLDHDPWFCHKWSLMRSSRSRRSYLGILNKDQIVSATVSQVDRIVFSEYTSGCFGCMIPNCCACECFGGTVTTIKSLYQAITTLDEHDVSTDKAWSRTQHQQHALIIRYLDLYTQLIDETVILLQPGSPMKPLYRLCSELSSSFNMDLWLSKHYRVPHVQQFSRLGLDAGSAVTITQFRLFYGVGFLIFLILAFAVGGYWLIFAVPSIIALGMPLILSGSGGLSGAGGEAGWNETLGKQYWSKGYVKVAAASMALALILLIFGI